MKSIQIFAFLLSLTFASGSALAQEPGDAGLFFDTAGTQTTAVIPGFIPFNIYLVVFDAPGGGIFGHEGSIQRDPSLTLLSSIMNPASSLNVGTPENWIIGTGTCFPSVGPTVLYTLEYIQLVPGLSDLLFILGPSTPSSFSPAVPGYLDCENNLRPYGIAANGNGIYPDGCAVGNPTELPPVATEQQSWGELKALYR